MVLRGTSNFLIIVLYMFFTDLVSEEDKPLPNRPRNVYLREILTGGCGAEHHREKNCHLQIRLCYNHHVKPPS